MASIHACNKDWLVCSGMDDAGWPGQLIPGVVGARAHAESFLPRSGLVVSIWKFEAYGASKNYLRPRMLDSEKSL